MDKELIRRIDTEIKRRADLPYQEMIDRMIREGFMDADGNVLVRRPEPIGDDWRSLIDGDFAMTDEQYQRVSRAIKERGERPSKVQFDEMVADGVIDRNGKVLIRSPWDELTTGDEIAQPDAWERLSAAGRAQLAEIRGEVERP